MHAVRTLDVNSIGEHVVIEILQHLEDGVVRGIAMHPTDWLIRGGEVESLGAPISVPVGE